MTDRLPRPAAERERRRAFSQIEGQTTEIECEWLLETAAAVQRGCVVEIGSFRGRSTCALAEGALRNPTRPAVFAVDPQEPFRGVLGGEFGPPDRVAFARNLDRAGLLEVTRLVNLPSSCVGPGFPHEIGLLWIDGDHRVAAVRADLAAWRHRLAPDAVVAFHDSLDPELGPAQVVGEMVDTGEWTVVDRIGLITALRRASS